jgi:hypothetical protein
VLKLSLMKDPFVATRAEEKPMELRRDSDWIRSRLYCTRLDTLREYDYVEYYMSNAFTSICPMIRFEFKHTFWMPDDVSLGPYSNGFEITCTGGCWVILQGRLVYERFTTKF